MKADLWTNINFFGNLIIKPLVNTITMAIAVDNFSGDSAKKEGWDDLSSYGLGIGLTWALICAVGESFSHRSLNSHNQGPSKSIELAQIFPDTFSMESSSELSDEVEAKSFCSIKAKYLVLIGDLCAHTADTNGPLTLAYHFLKPTDLSDDINIVVQVGILLLALTSAITEVRTCKHNIDVDVDVDNTYYKPQYHSLTESGHAHEAGHHSDVWVKINFPIEMLTIFLNNVVLVGALIDNSNKDVELSDLSKSALLCGIGWGFIIAIPTAHCHFMLNSNHQSKEHMLSSQASIHRKVVAPSLSCWRKIQRGIDMISHTTERASTLTSTIRILAPKQYSIAANLGIMLVTTAVAGPISLADSRTCYQNLLKYNSR